MANTHTEGTDDRKTISLWYCNGCDAAHLSAGGLRLTFNRDEFTTFTRMVVETQYSGWPSGITRSFSADHFDLDADQITASLETVH
jgi:hypothetical protein